MGWQGFNNTWQLTSVPYYQYSRSLTQDIIDAYNAGLINRDEARKALKLSLNYTFEFLDKTQELMND